MAKVRTEQSTVKYMAGGQGVKVAEPFALRDGRTVDKYYVVWLGEGHGLLVGDTARFEGVIDAEVSKRDSKYADLIIRKASVIEGSLVRAAAVVQDPLDRIESEHPWEDGPTDGDPWARGEGVEY